MNLAYLGDALDHWKGSLFEFLEGEGFLRDFAVDPMASDGALWTPHDHELFARLLRVTDAQILRHGQALAARTEYFAEIEHTGDLFVDPDTGIDTGGCSPADKYVTPQDLVELLQRSHKRVVAVYQHVRAQKTSDRVGACLRALARAVDPKDFAWCSYESGTVAMLFLSLDLSRTTSIAESFGRLLGRHAEGRVRSGVNRLAATQQGRAESVQPFVRGALQSRSPEYRCPIQGCDKVFVGARNGWDAHVGSPERHQDWYPDVRDPEERRVLFRSEFPEFFR